MVCIMFVLNSASLEYWKTRNNGPGKRDMMYLYNGILYKNVKALLGDVK